jgi:TonB family protein
LTAKNRRQALPPTPLHFAAHAKSDAKTAMVRSLSALLTHPASLTLSVALHLGALVAGGHALSERGERRAEAGTPIELEVELADAPPPQVARATPDEEAPPAAPVRAANAGHHHTYPVSPDHDARPHDPSLVHLFGGAPSAPLPPAPPIVTETTSEAPPNFVLASGGGLVTRGVTAPAPIGSAMVAEGPSVPDSETFAPILPESAVDTPARLLSSVPVVYPEAARTSEIEADVSLELVVDGDGHVTSARPLTAHDFGLADAAVRAVRAYRFTAARRAGRTVRVRMRWTVAFRLQ